MSDPVRDALRQASAFCARQASDDSLSGNELRTAFVEARKRLDAVLAALAGGVEQQPTAFESLDEWIKRESEDAAPARLEDGDIVERLRDAAGSPSDFDLLHDAAVEVERLRALVATAPSNAAAAHALAEALQKISDTAMSHPYAGTTCGEIARAALRAQVAARPSNDAAAPVAAETGLVDRLKSVAYYLNHLPRWVYSDDREHVLDARSAYITIRNAINALAPANAHATAAGAADACEHAWQAIPAGSDLCPECWSIRTRRPVAAEAAPSPPVDSGTAAGAHEPALCQCGHAKSAHVRGTKYGERVQLCMGPDCYCALYAAAPLREPVPRTEKD